MSCGSLEMCEGAGEKAAQRKHGEFSESMNFASKKAMGLSGNCQRVCVKHTTRANLGQQLADVRCNT